jgi:hypothetical protein
VRLSTPGTNRLPARGSSAVWVVLSLKLLPEEALAPAAPRRKPPRRAQATSAMVRPLALRVVGAACIVGGQRGMPVAPAGRRRTRRRPCRPGSGLAPRACANLRASGHHPAAHLPSMTGGVTPPLATEARRRAGARGPARDRRSGAGSAIRGNKRTRKVFGAGLRCLRSRTQAKVPSPTSLLLSSSPAPF